MASLHDALIADDPRNPSSPVPPTIPSGDPPVEEPDGTPPTREEPDIGDPVPSDAPMIA